MTSASASSLPRALAHFALAGVALVGALSLSSCATALDLLESATSTANAAAPETRDEETGEIVTGGTTDVFQIRLGDCLNDPAHDQDVVEVETVPCAEPHDYEVYHHAELPDGEYPVGVSGQADEICSTAFETFVGMPLEVSTLEFSHYTPTVGSWLDGDRAVDCLIYGAEQTAGSLKGAAR